MKVFISNIFILTFLPVCIAQAVWTNRGAEIISNPGAIIYCSGDMEIDSTGIFHHSGELQLDGSIWVKGALRMNGNLNLSGNIQNYGQVICTGGTTDLRGADQKVFGTGETRFYRFRVSGSGAKKLELDVFVNQLDLNDRLIETGSHLLFVDNAATDAISRLSGFVSSDSGGALVRLMDAGSDYLFPVGDQAVYAPIRARPALKSDTAGFRFAWKDAGTEGLSRNFIPEEICLTNPKFFSSMIRRDTGGMELRFHYPLEMSALYNALLTSNTSGIISWKHPYPVTISAEDTFYLATTLVHGALDEAFLLARTRPVQPQITGVDSFCVNETVVYTSDQEGGLSWIAGGGLIEISGSEAEFYPTQAGQAFIAAFTTDSAGCTSLPAERNLTVLPLPEAGIEIAFPAYSYEDQVFHLNHTGAGAASYNWYVEGVPSGNESKLNWSFDEPGDYLILLEVFNEFGCKSQLDTVVTIIPGLEFPDSFSPNGDGINDELQFLNSGLLGFEINIFNRWGSLVFSSKDPKFNWNGRDLKGEMVPSGTYFYRLDAEIPGHQYRNKGSITVLY